MSVICCNKIASQTRPHGLPRVNWTRNLQKTTVTEQAEVQETTGITEVDIGVRKKFIKTSPLGPRAKYQRSRFIEIPRVSERRQQYGHTLLTKVRKQLFLESFRPIQSKVGCWSWARQLRSVQGWCLIRPHSCKRTNFDSRSAEGSEFAARSTSSTG